MSTALILGVGNRLRGDDGAGPAVIDALAERPMVTAKADLAFEEGDGARIMERWQGYSRVWVIDACRSGAAPGSITRLDAVSTVLPRDLFPGTSHLFGLAEAVEMARALRRLPATLTVLGIEGGDFRHREALGPEVATAVRELVDQLEQAIDALPPSGNRSTRPPT